MPRQDPRLNFIANTLNENGTLPWHSDWHEVPRHFHAKVHRYAQYITRLNFEKYRSRDYNLTYHRLLEQTTRGYMGEMFFYILYGQQRVMMPDWYATPEQYWPNMKVSWAPDHLGELPWPELDHTIGFEDKTGRSCDPGWALQWSSGDTITRRSANRMPVAVGAVGENYYMVLIEHKRVHGNHMYRVAAIVKGLDVYHNRDFVYQGTPLLGPMANGNRHKKQLTKQVLYNSGVTFYRPAWVRTPRVYRPLFSDDDFPALEPGEIREAAPSPTEEAAAAPRLEPVYRNMSD